MPFPKMNISHWFIIQLMRYHYLILELLQALSMWNTQLTLKQKDLDLGAYRNAGYVCGPLRPRTVFMGLKFSLN